MLLSSQYKHIYYTVLWYYNSIMGESNLNSLGCIDTYQVCYGIPYVVCVEPWYLYVDNTGYPMRGKSSPYLVANMYWTRISIAWGVGGFKCGEYFSCPHAQLHQTKVSKFNSHYQISLIISIFQAIFYNKVSQKVHYLWGKISTIPHFLHKTITFGLK